MRFLLGTFALLSATSTLADTPRVVTDIAPVHGLVSEIMAGVGEPDLIIPPGASPHGYAMRPSQARALSQADVVFWVGPALTPWMAEPIETISENADHIALERVEGLTVLQLRQGARFEPHVHAEDDHDGHKHEHEDTETHDHDSHDHDAQDHGADDHNEEGGGDPHLWLDPQNAMLWLEEIAEKLAQLDPENAALYRSNAVKAQQRVMKKSAEIAAQLTPLQGRAFIVFHDAYHYFEARFGVEAVAALTLADTESASASRLAEVREVVLETNATCALAEPRAADGLIAAVAEGADIHIARIDAIGVDLVQGPDYYTDLLTQISDALTNCLAPNS